MFGAAQRRTRLVRRRGRSRVRAEQGRRAVDRRGRERVREEGDGDAERGDARRDVEGAVDPPAEHAQCAAVGGCRNRRRCRRWRVVGGVGVGGAVVLDHDGRDSVDNAVLVHVGVSGGLGELVRLVEHERERVA